MKKQEILNNIERSDVANCIALHDFSIIKPDLKKWMECVVDFFREYGIEPSKISSPSKTYNKLVGFKRGLLNHEKINYDIDSIEIYALPFNYHIEMFDGIFSAFIRNKISKTSCSIVFDSKIVNITDKSVKRITADLAKLTGAKYGYIFQREFSKIVGYECGAISGVGYDDPEGELINKWSNEYSMPDGAYKTGDMRDIYPMNIVSPAHLSRETFAGQTLEQWIARSSEHGVLENLCSDRWIWEVPLESISSVREALRPTGMLLCI